MWMYRGKFGTCLGGRYPGIEEGTKKSDSLFYVNHTYHVQCESHPASRVESHELEFCEKRVDLYHQSSGWPVKIFTKFQYIPVYFPVYFSNSSIAQNLISSIFKYMQFLNIQFSSIFQYTYKLLLVTRFCFFGYLLGSDIPISNEKPNNFPSHTFRIIHLEFPYCHNAINFP